MSIDPGLAGIVMTTIVSLVALIFRYFPSTTQKLQAAYPAPPVIQGKSTDDRLLELELNHKHLEAKVYEIKDTFKETINELTIELKEVKRIVQEIKEKP